MRKILLLVFVLVSFSAIGQVVQFPTNYGVGYRRTGADTLLWIPTDTFSVPGALSARTHIARKGVNLYYWTGTKWEGLSGGVTDTTSLSNRINLKVNIADTVNMLSPYLRSNVAAATYQPILVSGTNIKTINGSSLLGSGNLTISGGGGSSDSTLQQITDNGDSTTNNIITNDTTKAMFGFQKSTFAVGDSIRNSKTVTFIGHSVVASVGVLNYLEGWPWKTALLIGRSAILKGIAGTTLLHHTAGDSCAFDRLFWLPNWDAATQDGIYIQYDINDANITFGLDTASYRTGVNRYIDSLNIGRGIPLNKINWCSSNYLDTSITNNYDNIRLFVNVGLDAARKKGVNAYDLFYPMETDGGSYYLSDEDHPNSRGTSWIAKYIIKNTAEKRVGFLDIRGGANIDDSLRVRQFLRITDDTVGTQTNSGLNLINGGTTYLKQKVLIGTTTQVGSSLVTLQHTVGIPGLTVKESTQTTDIRGSAIKITNGSDYESYQADRIQMGNIGIKIAGAGGNDVAYFGIYGGAEIGAGEVLAVNALDSALRVNQGFRVRRGVRFDGLPTFADTTNYKPVVMNSSGTLYKATYWPGGGAGYTNLTQFVGQTNWRLFYSDGSGDVQELALGNSGQYLKSNGTSSVPSWATPTGGTGVDTIYRKAGQDSIFFTINGGLERAIKDSIGTGGGGTPAGSNTQIQFNNSGAFGASANLTWDGSTVFGKESSTATVPAFSVTTDVNTGFGILNANSDHAHIITAGTAKTLWNTTEMRLAQDYYLTWSTGSGGVYAGGSQVGIRRLAAGVLGITNGTTGSGKLVSPGFATGYASKSADYTLTATDYTIEVTATGKTMTLPTAVGVSGQVYTIKLTASGTGTVATTSSQTIDGSTTYSLSAQYKYVTVQSNGSNWIIIANN